MIELMLIFNAEEKMYEKLEGHNTARFLKQHPETATPVAGAMGCIGHWLSTGKV